MGCRSCSPRLKAVADGVFATRIPCRDWRVLQLRALRQQHLPQIHRVDMVETPLGVDFRAHVLAEHRVMIEAARGRLQKKRKPKIVEPETFRPVKIAKHADLQVYDLETFRRRTVEAFEVGLRLRRHAHVVVTPQPRQTLELSHPVVPGYTAFAIAQNIDGGKVEDRLAVEADVRRPVGQIVVDERAALLETERVEQVGQAVLADETVCGVTTGRVGADLVPDSGVANVPDADSVRQPGMKPVRRDELLRELMACAEAVALAADQATQHRMVDLDLAAHRTLAEGLALALDQTPPVRAQAGSHLVV